MASHKLHLTILWDTGVYFNTAPSDVAGLFFGATHLQNSSAADVGVAKGFLADSNSTVDYSMTGSNQVCPLRQKTLYLRPCPLCARSSHESSYQCWQGMFTNGSAINNFWSDTTLMDNLRAADITATSVAGSLETIGANTAATNVRGGHSVHDASDEAVKGGWLNTAFNQCSDKEDGCLGEAA